MAQLKAHEIDAWLSKPHPGIPIVLIYGPDRGLVSERAQIYARACGVPLDDAFSTVRLDAGDVERQPGRLLDEANTMPMFAGRRLIWVRNALGQKALAADVKGLCATPPIDVHVLIEAGDLKKAMTLRSVAEGSAVAMTLPCFADDEAAIDRLIDSELKKIGVAMNADARVLFRAFAGADRLATRSEIEKLALFSIGTGRIDSEDIRALGGDAASASSDDMVDAVLIGDLDALDRSFAAQIRAGAQTYGAISTVQRQLQSLQLMRLAVDNGRSASIVVAEARPQIFYKRRALVESALKRWTSAALCSASTKLHETVLQTRRRPDLGVSLTYQALLSIAISARTSGVSRSAS